MENTKTVADLIKVLQSLPPTLPVGTVNEHMEFESYIPTCLTRESYATVRVPEPDDPEKPWKKNFHWDCMKYLDISSIFGVE